MKNKIYIVFFAILTLIGLLFITNFTVYEAIISIFKLYNYSLVIALILAGLSICLVISFVIGRDLYNKFSQIFYLVSMIWLGYFGYLLITSFAYFITLPFSGAYAQVIGCALFALATCVSIYGVIHGKKIYIKHIPITIPNLPASWRGRKIAFISDVHIGQINGEKFLKKIIEKVQSVSPDVVFIGGDLYDGSETPKILKLIEPLKKLSSPLGTFFVSGNHEEYGNHELFLQTIRETGIRVLNNEKILLDGIQLIGVDFHTTAKKSEFKKILDRVELNTSIPSILLKHAPDNINVAKDAGISLQISGHTHRGQQWPFGYIAALMFGKFTYGLHMLGNTQVYTSSGVGTWGPPLRVRTNSEIILFHLI
jgi:predicted MPP superfamily phosphohydrolase